MKKELKDKWVAALRSDKYTQGREKLRTDDGSYCCLGVLCEVLDVPRRDTFERWEYVFEGQATSLQLTAALRQHAGLSSAFEYDLISMNDDQRKTFDEIADYIESELAS
jgi:hypothetical protein